MHEVNRDARVAGKHPAFEPGTRFLPETEADRVLAPGHHSPWQVGKSGQASAA